jgi:hypothetical protein
VVVEVVVVVVVVEGGARWSAAAQTGAGRRGAGEGSGERGRDGWREYAALESWGRRMQRGDALTNAPWVSTTAMGGRRVGGVGDVVAPEAPRSKNQGGKRWCLGARVPENVVDEPFKNLITHLSVLCNSTHNCKPA